MRMHRIGAGLALGLVMAACQVRLSTGPNAGGPRPAPVANNAPAPAAAPPPAAPATPPAPAPAVTPAAPATAAPAPSPKRIILRNAAYADVGGLRKPLSLQLRNRIRTLRLQRPAALVNVTAASSRNTAEIMQIRLRPKSVCGLVEVAPNRVVSIDCQPYAPPVRVKKINPQRFLRMMRAHRLRLDPKDVGGVGGVGYPAGEGPTPAYPSSEGGAEDEIPIEVDFRKNGTAGPIRDQEQVGACTAFSLSATMDQAIRRLNKGEVMSAMHVWSHYGFPNMNNAAEGNLQKPIAEDAAWKYDAPLACRMYKGSSTFSCSRAYKGIKENTADGDPAVQAKIKEVDGLGKFKITAVEQLDTDPDVIVAALARGNAIWSAFQINGEWWSNDHMQRGALIPDWPSPTSGHAVVIAGYRKVGASRQFLIQNSWATDWGDGGFAWINESALKQRLSMAFTLKVEPKDQPPPPPPPTPPSAGDTCPSGQAHDARDPSDASCYATCTGAGQCGGGLECEAGLCLPGARPENNADIPTDDDCSWDELVDAVTLKCATICPDDTRPSNGCTSGGGRKR